MELLSDKVIVLKSSPFEERSLIVQALSENHGRVSAIAKNGIQSKRFGGALNTFSASQWSFSRKSEHQLYFLKEATILNSFHAIRHDLQQFALASALNELLLKIVQPNQPTTKLFQLHSNTLSLIDLGACRDQERLVFNHFFSRILIWMGLYPQWSTCLHCKEALSEAL